jgi:Protein of unknown function (DUF3126)
MTPEEIKSLQNYLRKKFDLNAIDVRKQHIKEDSAEVFIKKEFIGVIYKDDEDDEISYQFQMAILEDDLKD